MECHLLRNEYSEKYFVHSFNKYLLYAQCLILSAHNSPGFTDEESELGTEEL